MREMDKVFRPQEAEDRLYAEWMDKGYFTAKRVPGKKPFVIMMPPPNITGQLHMGHAMDAMPQDVLTRYHRMKGDPTLWLPGTDHASIATEVKIIDALKSEGLTKQDLGREGFLERAWQWREEYGRRIVEQQKKLGASCDWSRERFTMDEGLNKAVIEVFVRLYEKGLIYRGNRIINWCPTCKTALSDAEVEYEEQDTSLWYIRYPGADGDVVVATTRPETMLGDTGVAVNPEDPRYTGLAGKTVTLPIMDREIPIVGDAYVDPAFGTGAVKMTPAHDPNDFEVGLRHGLPVLCVLTDEGYMNENAGRFQGMTRLECRRKVVEELKELGLLVKTEPLQHNVGTCYRCHDTVEPMVSTQWFVKMAPLAKPAAEAARTGELTFIPERFTKTYLNWMDNIRDWCISRQLWWGHRIPAYYCDDCGEMTVARKAPDACPACGGALRQDEDVLDTWFSSALWPFSTLGWPEQTEDLAYFYPTSVMISGYDILFFWDARMIFSGIEQMGKLPFDTVLLHGLVRDAQGRKMSKSLGNGIDPLEMVEKYGCDALRFSLAMGVAPGNDVRFSEEKIEGFRNFANKIWNASRFVLMNLDGMPAGIQTIDPSVLDTGDRWILTRFGEAVEGVTGNLESYELGLAATKIYEFAWSSFCDWYIELAKQKLNGEDEAAREATRAVLYHVLLGILKLLHPFMPFLTDEVYRHLPKASEDPESIMIAPWPAQPDKVYPEDAARMEGVMEVIRAIRNLRAEMNVQAGKRASLILRPREGWKDVLAASEQYFKRLAYTTQLELIGPETPNPDNAASAVTAPCELFIPLGELVDIDREVARLGRDRQTVEAEIARGEGKLKNEGFLTKAPEALVQAEQEKLATNRQVLQALEERIRELSALA